jgi:hypothetical protein
VNKVFRYMASILKAYLTRGRQQKATRLSQQLSHYLSEPPTISEVIHADAPREEHRVVTLKATLSALIGRLGSLPIECSSKERVIYDEMMAELSALEKEGNAS